MIYILHGTKDNIPWPHNPSKYDIAEVFFPPHNGYVLVQYYTYNGDKWIYYDYKLLNSTI